jgi:hypothetical protein
MSDHVDLDAHIPYRQYYLEHIGKAKISGDQLTGLCPFHDDKKASFGVNLKTSESICRAGCFEGNIISFHAKIKNLSNQEAYQDLCRIYNVPSGKSGRDATDERIIPVETLELFQPISAALLAWMKEVRGWSEEIIAQYYIGYNPKKRFQPGFVDGQRITIPVFDERKDLVNIRSYKPKAAEGEQKLISYSTGSRKKGNWIGYGQARLYPLNIIHEAREANEIIHIVEGEPDTLCGLSHEIYCVTQTAGAETWLDEWNVRFKGQHVRVLLDNDQAGIKGTLRIIQHLPAFCKKIECRVWPDFMEDKQDLTDWFMTHKKTKEDLDTLIEWISPEEFKKRFGEAGPGGKDEDPVDKCVHELNEKHSIIMLGGKCLVMNEVIDPVFSRPDITFSAPSDFKNKYANQKLWIPNGKGTTKAVSVANLWFEHPERREYDGLVFAPGQETPGCYNLYRGMAYEPKKGCWERLQEHIYHVLCQKDSSLFTYLIGWMADAVQNPGGDRPGVSIVLRGGKGVGKGIVFRTFGELFGGHFVHVEHQSQLVGKFNHHLKDALIVFADECFFAGDKQAESTIKRIITEPTIRIEPKGKESFAVKNYMRLTIASNESWVIPAGIKERRFLVLDVENFFLESVTKQKYFAPIYAEIKNGGHEAMLYDLLDHKYEKDSLLEAPRTDALLSQIEEGMTPECKFWYHRLKEGTVLREHNQWEESFVQSEKIHAQYIDFSQKLGKTYLDSPESLSRKIRSICPCIRLAKQYVSSSAQARGWKCGPLKVCRAAFEKALGQSVDWEEGE